MQPPFWYIKYMDTYVGLSFVFENINHFGSEIIYHFRGSIKRHQSAGHDQNSYSCIEERVQFKNLHKSVKFCRRQQNKTLCQDNMDDQSCSKSNSRTDLLISQSHVQHREIDIFAKVQTPVRSISLRFKVVLLFNTASWLNVIVERKPSSEQFGSLSDKYSACNILLPSMFARSSSYPLPLTGHSIEHVLMLRMRKTSLAQNNFFLGEIRLYTITNDFSGYTLHLKASLFLKQLYEARFFATSHSFLSVNIRLNNDIRRKLPRSEVDIVWMDDQYLRFSQLSMQLNFSCPMETKLEHLTCVKLITTTTTNVILKQTVAASSRKLNFWSWEEASDLCTAAGGFLPSFRSKEELTELLAAFKLSPFMPRTNALLIGLKFQQENKVDFLVGNQG